MLAVELLLRLRKRSAIKMADINSVLLQNALHAIYTKVKPLVMT